jgi:hypothetical protein
LIHGKQISADLLDAPRDSITVQRSQDIESLQDHQRQCALKDVRFLFHSTAILVSNRKDGTLPLGKQQESVENAIDDELIRTAREMWLGVLAHAKKALC